MVVNGDGVRWSNLSLERTRQILIVYRDIEKVRIVKN